MSLTNVGSRKKRRQEGRRLKRNAMQSMMVLKGWVPVQINAQYGIYHAADNKLVLRRWYVGSITGVSPAAPYPLPPGRWVFQCIQLSSPFEGREVRWHDIQLRWVYAMRSAAIQMGWL